MHNLFFEYFIDREKIRVIKKLWLGEVLSTLWEQYLFFEMAEEGDDKVNIAKGKLYYDQDDVNYLYQFPENFWSTAMEYRYKGLIYNTWLRSQAKNYYDDADGNSEEKFQETSKRLGQFGNPDQVKQWLTEGNLQYDFVLLKGRGTGTGDKFFVRTDGVKLYEKLIKPVNRAFLATAEDTPQAAEEYSKKWGFYGLDIKFRKKGDQVEWLGYEPFVNWSEKKRQWEIDSSAGWFSQGDEKFDSLPRQWVKAIKAGKKETHGKYVKEKLPVELRILPKKIIEQMNAVDNPNRLSALQNMIKNPGILAARGIDLSEGADKFVQHFAFGVQNNARTFGFIRNGVLETTTSALPALSPSKEVHLKSQKQYNALQVAKKNKYDALLEKINKIIPIINLPESTLSSHANAVRQELSKNPDSAELQRNSNVLDGAIKIQQKLKGSLPLDIKDPAQMQLLEKALQDFPYTSKELNDFEAIEQQQKEIVKNSKTLTPFEAILPANRKFRATQTTGQVINMVRMEEIYAGKDFVKRWNDENHNQYFFYTDLDTKRQVAYYKTPWDDQTINPGSLSERSPADKGVMRSILNFEELHPTVKRELRDSWSALLFYSEKQIEKILGYPEFVEYLNAYAQFKNNPNNEEDVMALKVAYKNAAEKLTARVIALSDSVRQKLRLSNKAEVDFMQDVKTLKRTGHRIRGKERIHDLELDADPDLDVGTIVASTINQTCGNAEKLPPMFGKIDDLTSGATASAQKQVPQDYPNHNAEVRKRALSVLYHSRYNQLATDGRIPQRLKSGSDLQSVVCREIFNYLKQKGVTTEFSKDLRMASKDIPFEVYPDDALAQKLKSLDSNLKTRDELQTMYENGFKELGISITGTWAAKIKERISELLQQMHIRPDTAVAGPGSPEERRVPLGKLANYLRPRPQTPPTPAQPQVRQEMPKPTQKKFNF